MKHNKFNTWLTSLLVMVMLALVGQTAMAQDATFDLRNQDVKQLTSGNVQVTFANYSQGANIWNAYYDSYSLKVNGLNSVQISKIEFEIYQMGYAYDTVVEKNGRGTFTYNHSGTSTWTGSSSEVQFVGTSSSTDVYVTALRVWTGTGGDEPTPDDGSKTYTYNFNGSAISYMTGGASSTLTSGKNLQVNDVFTAEGGTLTFTAVASAWSNNGQRLRLGSGTAFTIAAPEGYLISEIVFNTDENTLSGLSATGLTFNSTTKATWTGSAASVPVSVTSNSWVQTIKVKVVPASVEPETYTVSISGNPSEAKITYDGTQYADGDTFTATGLTSEAITATAIEGYVYSVTIDGTTIKVEYSEAPSIKIDYVTIGWNTTVASGDQMEKIESVQVYLQDAIDYIDGMPVGMTFTDGAGNEQTISYCYMQGGYDSNWNYIYNGFYFGFNNTITAPGTYTLHIPAGAIKNSTTGLENKEINFQFVIPTPVQFAAPTLTPAEGNVESLKEFTLTAPAGVTFDTSRDLSNITINGNTEYIYDYEYAQDGSSLTFRLNGEYTTDGTATIVLPLGFVRSTTNEYCPEVIATYTVAYPWYEISTYSALEPADNAEVKSLSTITIDAPEGVTFDCTSEGEERNVTVSLNGNNEVIVANVYADHIVLNYGTTAVGTYAFVIPASTFAANSGAKSNKEISFTYTILPTLTVSNVGWTTFCYDHNFTLADGYTPYMIQTAEDGVAEPVEILGVPKTETIKGYIYNYNGTPDMQATADGTYITAPCFENKVQVTYGGTMSGGDYFEVYAGAWVEVKGLNGTEVVSVVPRSWDPFSYDSYNFEVSDIEDGIRVEWTGYSYFGGLDINIAIAGEYEKPIIPANTGILVQGDPAQDITYEKTYAAASDVTGNILTGCTADNTVTNDADHLFYKFSLNASRDAGSEGFYWDSNDGHSINMHAGKAYLILDASAAGSVRGFRFFGGETESITSVATDSENAPAFNLQGQRVNKNNFPSGLYIQNGKKVLVK